MALACLQESGPSHFARLKINNKIGSRWWSIRTCAHPLLRTYQNSSYLLNNRFHEDAGPHKKKKKIPHNQGQT